MGKANFGFLFSWGMQELRIMWILGLQEFFVGFAYIRFLKNALNLILRCLSGRNVACNVCTPRCCPFSEVF